MRRNPRSGTPWRSSERRPSSGTPRRSNGMETRRAQIGQRGIHHCMVTLRCGPQLWLHRRRPRGTLVCPHGSRVYSKLKACASPKSPKTSPKSPRSLPRAAQSIPKSPRTPSKTPPGDPQISFPLPEAPRSQISPIFSPPLPLFSPIGVRFLDNRNSYCNRVIWGVKCVQHSALLQ